MRNLTRIALAVSLSALFASVAAARDAGARAPDSAGAATNNAAVAPRFEATLAQQFDTSAPIKAGETVDVTFQITHPAGATVSFPTAYSPERWVLIGAERLPTAEGERATKSEWLAKFGIYRPGMTTLDSFEITVSTPDGQTVLLPTEPVEVKVLSIFADATSEPEFIEPRPPVPVWVEDYTLAFVGGGALAFALLGLVAWGVRRRQLMVPPPPPPPRAAHEIAIEKLGALAADDLVERGEYMLYWVRLSEAIREYLGRSYGFPGTEFTTTEMLVILERVEWPVGLGLDDIHRFLRRCDEVKFGGAEPNVEESTATLRRAFSFVELTKPRLAPAVALPTAGGLGDGDTEVEEEGVATIADSAEAKPRWAPPAEPSDPQEEE